MKRAIEQSVWPVLLVAASAMVGSPALFAVGVGLVLVHLGVRWLVKSGTERLVCVRTADRFEVLEGQPVTLRFEAQGLAGLPTGAELLAPGGEWVELVMGRSELTVVIDRPGAHVIAPTTCRVRDDLGLHERFVAIGQPVELLVLPAPAATAETPRRGAATVADPEPDGLRTYQRGTPMSRIHWPSLARGAELQERAFRPGFDELPLVTVDTAGAAGPGAVDWAVRLAAGHVSRLLRGGGCRLLLPGDRAPHTLMDPIVQWPAVHRRLATLEPGQPVVSLPGADLSHALQVHASAAPHEAITARAALPVGVLAAADLEPTP